MGFQKWKKSEENQLALFPQINMKILTVLKVFFELFLLHINEIIILRITKVIGGKWRQVIVVYIQSKCIWGPKPSGGFYFLTVEWSRHIGFINVQLSKWENKRKGP